MAFHRLRAHQGINPLTTHITYALHQKGILDIWATNHEVTPKVSQRNCSMGYWIWFLKCPLTPFADRSYMSLPWSTGEDNCSWYSCVALIPHRHPLLPYCQNKLAIGYVSAGDSWCDSAMTPSPWFPCRLALKVAFFFPEKCHQTPIKDKKIFLIGITVSQNTNLMNLLLSLIIGKFSRLSLPESFNDLVSLSTP